MQNKCNCGCEQGFVPVNGNWDFNMDGDCGCQQNNSRRNRRGCDDGCSECGKNISRTRKEDDCQCERCGDTRRVACCEENTYIRQRSSDCQYDRRMDECVCKGGNRDNGYSDECQQCGECEAAYRRNHTSCTGDDNCQCETCVRNRRRGNDCGEYKDSDAYGRNRSGQCDCGKDNDNASTYARSGKNRKVGMVNVEMQEIDKVFESESALRAGTLFPELHKPMNGYCLRSEHCGTCKQAAAFAAWEMRLYLNTHPNDKEALALFGKLCKEAEEENYATTFLTDECCTNGWKWVKNPWPWEYDCRCGD